MNINTQKYLNKYIRFSVLQFSDEALKGTYFQAITLINEFTCQVISTVKHLTKRWLILSNCLSKYLIYINRTMSLAYKMLVTYKFNIQFMSIHRMIIVILVVTGNINSFIECQTSSILSIQQVLNNLIFTTTLWSRFYF